MIHLIRNLCIIFRVSHYLSKFLQEITKWEMKFFCIHIYFFICFVDRKQSNLSKLWYLCELSKSNCLADDNHRDLTTLFESVNVAFDDNEKDARRSEQISIIFIHVTIAVSGCCPDLYYYIAFRLLFLAKWTIKYKRFNTIATNICMASPYVRVVWRTAAKCRTIKRKSRCWIMSMVLIETRSSTIERRKKVKFDKTVDNRGQEIIRQRQLQKGLQNWSWLL